MIFKNLTNNDIIILVTLLVTGLIYPLFALTLLTLIIISEYEIKETFKEKKNENYRSKKRNDEIKKNR